MKNKKTKIQIVLILMVAIGALIFSIVNIFTASKDITESFSEPISDTVQSSYIQETEDKPKDNADFSEDQNSEETIESKEPAQPQEPISYGVNDEEAADFMSIFYNTDMFGVKQPKDLLENEEFMASLQQYGMSEEEIWEAINEIQIEYEKSLGDN